MPFEEKRAWIMVVVSIATYAVYVAIILGRAGADTPPTEVPYAATLLWTVGASILATIVLHIIAAILAPQDADRKDQRDREIHRFGEYIGQWFLVAGGVGALVLALLESDYFWIANTIYLGFVLSSVLGSSAKIFAYRRGFQPW
ncbi:hypothetical protein F4553_002287 [Allocatelliglobosispora scoriae]|uniref:DUF2178 domain-containing protein n=1 Tax=Allocatelliglobosispora scoriae TaxID=643052 RepID=A0A841BNE6_9ACTN|nr:hypothetical protein [Allocatelliglobosispora scoriae]MBB5868908.1 hypothetical protein [Allocatelliglobosispora scoriae]